MTYSGWPAFKLQIAPGWSPLDADPVWRTIHDDATDGTADEVLQLRSCQIARGRSGESENAVAGRASFVIDDADTRDFDPFNTLSKWYATYLDTAGSSYAASTSDVSDITGDSTFTLRYAADDWTPAAIETLAAKSNATGNQRSMQIQLTTGGALSWVWSADGVTNITKTSTDLISDVATAGVPVWLKFEHDVNNGAAGNDVTISYSLEDVERDDQVTAWTELLSVTTAGTTSHFNTTAGWTVGATAGGTNPASGKVYYFKAQAGLSSGTASVDVNFGVGWGAGTTSLTDDAGVAWTVNSGSAITADTSRGSWIRPRLPVRYVGTLSAVDYPVFRGHVNAVEQSYPSADGGERSATLVCSDLFNVMATVSVSERSAWAASIEALSPVAWWRLGESLPSGASTLNTVTATDETGAYNGFYAGDTPMPADGLIDGDQSPGFSTGTNGAVIIPTAPTYASNEPVSALLWFTAAPIGGTDRVILNSGFPLYVEASTGLLVWERLGSADIVTSATRVDDGLPHMVALVTPSIAGAGSRPGTMYLDGVSQGSASNLIASGASWFVGIDYDGSLLFQNGVIDELVALNVAIDATQAADLYAAGLDSWAGETTGARIARAAELAGIPAALLNLDDGDSTVVGWSGGSSTLDVAQKCNSTEQGVLVVEGDGVLTFKARSSLYNLTPVATLIDDGTGTTYSEHDGESSEQRIVNRARFTSTAGTALAFDQPSIEAFGVHDNDRQTLDDVVENLAAGAQYAVHRGKDPEGRITTLEVDPTFDGAAAWVLVLTLLMGDRVTFARQFDTGSDIEDDFIVTGLGHSQNADPRFRTRLQVTTADTTDYFTLDDNDLGLLDGDAVLAF